MGLISHFKTQDESLLPKVTKNVVIKVPMSKYQFIQYSNIRLSEIEQDKRKNQKKKSKKSTKSTDTSGESLFEDKSSSYRCFSRMHCSVVFPEHISRPYPNSEQITDKKIIHEHCITTFRKLLIQYEYDNEFSD